MVQSAPPFEVLEVCDHDPHQVTDRAGQHDLGGFELVDPAAQALQLAALATDHEARRWCRPLVRCSLSSAMAARRNTRDQLTSSPSGPSMRSRSSRGTYSVIFAIRSGRRRQIDVTIPDGRLVVLT